MSKDWREQLDALADEYAVARQFKLKGNGKRYRDTRDQMAAEIEAAVAVAEAEIAYRERPALNRQAEYDSADKLDTALAAYRHLKARADG